MLKRIHEHPIIIRRNIDEEKNRAYKFFCSNDSQVTAQISGATFYVMHILRQLYPDRYPERGAVWFNYELIKPHTILHVTNKTGDMFPDHTFERNCRLFCIEKTTRTINNDLLCSHQDRDTSANKWGGSARFDFSLEAHKGTFFPITIVGACSGRKEWEDLAITLTAFIYVGILQFNDPQMQHILRLAEASVIGDPTANPPDKSISKFTQELCTHVML